MFKVNNRQKNCELYSRLTVKTPERRQWRCFSVFIETIEHISHLFLVFLLFSLSMYFVAVSNVVETLKVWFSFVFMLVKLVIKWNQWSISSVIIVELEQLCFKSIVVKFLFLTVNVFLILFQRRVKNPVEHLWWSFSGEKSLLLHYIRKK